MAVFALSASAPDCQERQFDPAEAKEDHCLENRNDYHHNRWDDYQEKKKWTARGCGDRIILLKAGIRPLFGVGECIA